MDHKTFGNQTNIHEDKMRQRRSQVNEPTTVGYLSFCIYQDTGSDKLAATTMTKPRVTNPKVA